MIYIISYVEFYEFDDSDVELRVKVMFNKDLVDLYQFVIEEDIMDNDF